MHQAEHRHRFSEFPLLRTSKSHVLNLAADAHHPKTTLKGSLPLAVGRIPQDTTLKQWLRRIVARENQSRIRRALRNVTQPKSLSKPKTQKIQDRKSNCLVVTIRPKAGFPPAHLPASFQLDKAQKAFLKHKTFHGNEIVAATRRLCLMNMFLHNISEIDGQAMISSTDALVAPAPPPSTTS